ncbi:MAG: Transposase IS116/IS110/IS902 family protein [Spirochaetes bacterium ADurb.Bin110]|nr:MAG: Transposase IS116/IS110/IS902 family protein [Spirochaetes bacterium ADurb.Bin110]
MEGKRFVGIDLAKRHYEACVLEEQRPIRRWSGKTDFEGRAQLARNLCAGDVVALEAGASAINLARRLMKVEGVEVVLLNPASLAIIYGSMKKTDKEDSLKLARIIQTMPKESLPIVALPSKEEEQARRLANQQMFLKQERTRMLNRLHGLFVEQGVTTITKKDLAKQKARSATLLQLSGVYRTMASQDCTLLAAIEEQIVLVNEEIHQMLCARQGEAEILMSIPGVGPVAALAFLGFIGNGDRFANASQVSYYAGLVPRVDFSGDSVHHVGHITKKGSPALRRALVQAAWSAVRTPMGSHFREVYDRIAARRGKRIAIVAVARKILELMYTLMKKHELYCYATAEQRQRKLKLYKLGSLQSGTVLNSTIGSPHAEEKRSQLCQLPIGYVHLCISS